VKKVAHKMEDTIVTSRPALYIAMLSANK